MRIRQQQHRFDDNAKCSTMKAGWHRSDNNNADSTTTTWIRQPQYKLTMPQVGMSRRRKPDNADSTMTRWIRRQQCGFDDDDDLDSSTTMTQTRQPWREFFNDDDADSTTTTWIWQQWHGFDDNDVDLTMMTWIRRWRRGFDDDDTDSTMMTRIRWWWWCGFDDHDVDSSMTMTRIRRPWGRFFNDDDADSTTMRHIRQRQRQIWRRHTDLTMTCRFDDDDTDSTTTTWIQRWRHGFNDDDTDSTTTTRIQRWQHGFNNDDVDSTTMTTPVSNPPCQFTSALTIHNRWKFPTTSLARLTAPTNKADDERIWTQEWTTMNVNRRWQTRMAPTCRKHSTMATKRRTPHADENEQWGSPIIKKVCTFACQLTWVLTTCERPGNHISTALSLIGYISISILVLYPLYMINVYGTNPTSQKTV